MNLIITKQTNLHIILGEVETYFQNYNIEQIKKMEIKTIISEIIYNIQKYTPRGSIQVQVNDDTVYIKASDHGKGIENFDQVIKDGYSSSGTLGLGLASLFRLSDEIDIQTSENGTTIDIKKRIK